MPPLINQSSHKLSLCAALLIFRVQKVLKDVEMMHDGVCPTALSLSLFLSKGELASSRSASAFSGRSRDARRGDLSLDI